MTDKIGHNTAELLKKYIEGVEMYEGQKKDISESVKEIFDNAKTNGLDVKTIKKIIARRKVEAHKLDEEDFLLDSYQEALSDLPLFKQ